MTSSIEVDAALLTRAAMAEAAMYGDKDSCMPLNGARPLPLLEVRRRVFDDYADVGGWAPNTRDLPTTFVEEIESQSKSNIARFMWWEIAREPPYSLLWTP